MDYITYMETQANNGANEMTKQENTQFIMLYEGGAMWDTEILNSLVNKGFVYRAGSWYIISKKGKANLQNAYKRFL